jgi:hypothetical protein
MTSADTYRAKAIEFSKMANGEKNPRLQVEYAGMAQAYFRLAVLADKNRKNDLVYEALATEGQKAAE